MDQVAFQLSSVKDTQVALEAMQSASKALKQETKKLDLDKIETMQDELEDMFEDMEEITGSLGRNVANTEYIGDDELDAELACLEDEIEFEDSGPTELPSYLMPDAPTVTPATAAPEAAQGEKVEEAADEVDAYGLPTK